MSCPFCHVTSETPRDDMAYVGKLDRLVAILGDDIQVFSISDWVSTFLSVKK